MQNLCGLPVITAVCTTFLRCSHDGRKQRARSHGEGAGSTQAQGRLSTTSTSNLTRTADEQGGKESGEDDVVGKGKGKASAQDGTAGGGGSSEGVGGTRQPECPEDSAVGGAVPANQVKGFTFGPV